jgi:hypothetical protein
MGDKAPPKVSEEEKVGKEKDTLCKELGKKLSTLQEKCEEQFTTLKFTTDV